MENIVLIQGALDIEIDYLLLLLENKQVKKIAEYEFYEGFLHHVHVVISKTLVGSMNASVATTLGILHFNPRIVINQGIAGSHSETLHIGDIVIGEKCSNINAYKIHLKAKGEGSNPLEWEPNKRAKEILHADSKLVDIFKRNIISSNSIVCGTLGSGDIFNREYDRIIWTSNTFHTLCEDMESIGAYFVCNKLEVPCIGIRIISNNELLHEKINKEKAIELQKCIVDVLNYI